jgi:hypothetical protein
MQKRLGAVIVGVVLAVALAASPAFAAAPEFASGSSPLVRTSAHGSKLHLAVHVTRFAISRGRTVAKGTVNTKLTDLTGKNTFVKAPVTLAVKNGGSCRVLHLQLDKLTLVLLGLNVNLDKVILDVTGRRGGGVLGRLFCKLSRAKVAGAGAQESAVKALNARLHKSSLTPLAFTVPLSQKVLAAQAGSCPVLDLVLGPLNLDLLGLVVDLNRVHLNITATRGRGALGNLFCSLSA